MEHKTIIRTHDPDNGDRYVTLLAMDGSSYPITSATRLTINGTAYAVVRSQVDIVTVGLVTAGEGMVLTTITVVADDGS